MIPHNELRLGNIIDVVSAERWRVKLQGLWYGSYSGIRVQTDKVSGIELQHCFPIPLTPEILQKCGFERITSECYSNHPKFYFEFGSEFNAIVVGTHRIKTEYLHQLQNLVFAFAQKELEINL